MHFVEKMLLFNSEVRYKIHSGSEIVRIRIRNDLFRIRKKVPDQTGSGSTTLQ
jgi:hypothetical protein